VATLNTHQQPEKMRYQWWAMDLNGIRVRAVDLDDSIESAAWLKLLDQYARSPEGMGTPLAPHVSTTLAQRLALWPGFYTWMAWDGRHAAGLINCFTGFSTFAGRALLNVHDLFVAPDFRRRGVARQLLSRAEEEAKHLGCCKLTLEVLELNPARHLYADFGFQPYQLSPTNGRALFLEKKLGE
jgi:GNAT superfamily N-acetyltransferase